MQEFFTTLQTHLELRSQFFCKIGICEKSAVCFKGIPLFCAAWPETGLWECQHVSEGKDCSTGISAQAFKSGPAVCPAINS